MDQQVLNVISRCAQYTETTLKALSNAKLTEASLPQLENDFADIIKIQQAEIKYPLSDLHHQFLSTIRRLLYLV